MVDIDGVEEGRYGKNRPPVDFNRDWSYKPQHREVNVIQETVERLAARFKYVLFANFHSPQPGGMSYLIPARRSHMGDEKCKDFWKFAYEYEKSLEDVCGFNVMG